MPRGTPSLATQRAQNVAATLAAAGVDAGRIDVAQPVLADDGTAPEEVAAGRASRCRKQANVASEGGSAAVFVPGPRARAVTGSASG